MAFRKLPFLKKIWNRPQIINTSETITDIQSNTLFQYYLNQPYCGKCDIKLNEFGWCKECKKNRLLEHTFDKWTSGNKDIDDFIQKIQLSNKYNVNIVEWIPF